MIEPSDEPLSLVKATAGILAGIRDKIIDPREITRYCFQLPLDVANFIRKDRAGAKQDERAPKQVVNGNGKEQPVKASVSGFRKFLASKGISKATQESIIKFDGIKSWLLIHPKEARSYADEANLLVKKEGKIDKNLITTTLEKIGLSTDEVNSSTGWYPAFAVAQSASDKAATPASEVPDPGKSDPKEQRAGAQKKDSEAKASEPKPVQQPDSVPVDQAQDPYEQLIFGDKDELLSVDQVLQAEQFVQPDFYAFANESSGVFQGKTEPKIRESINLGIAFDNINNGTKVQKMACIRGAFAGITGGKATNGSQLKHVTQKYEEYDESVDGEKMNSDQLKVFQTSVTLIVRTHNALKQSMLNSGIEPSRANWRLLMQENTFLSVIGSVCEKLANDPDFFGSSKSGWKNLPSIPKSPTMESGHV
jgi:hypothetical protein